MYVLLVHCGSPGNTCSRGGWRHSDGSAPQQSVWLVILASEDVVIYSSNVCVLYCPMTKCKVCITREVLNGIDQYC